MIIWHVVKTEWANIGYTKVEQYLPILEEEWGIGEYDTLMRYYELSWDAEKAKKFANKYLHSWAYNPNSTAKANHILRIE